MNPFFKPEVVCVVLCVYFGPGLSLCLLDLFPLFLLLFVPF